MGGFGFHATFVDDFNLITRMNSEFKENNRFIQATSFAQKLTNQERPLWISHVILWAAETSIRLDGDFIELGVEKGFHSLSIINYVGVEKFSKKKFYLLDSWEGVDIENLLPEEKIMDDKWNVQFQGNFPFIESTFGDFNFIKLIKGFVPDTLKLIDSESIAFVHLDLNSANPEVDALKYLWSKIKTGGIVILDDYNAFSREPQKHAIDKLADELSFSVLSLPTGQGMIIK
jgi:hypothetical protein